MASITITRKQLYEQVWSEPTMHLAKRYGLSDVGFAKLCRRFDIPRPPRGHWAKKQFGKASRRTPLPNPDDDSEILKYDPDSPIASAEVNGTLSETVEAEKNREAPIEVAETLHGSHQLVREARQQLESSDTDRNGLLVPPDGKVLDIRVAKSSLRRSLLIMNALLKACEAKGYVVTLGPRVELLDVKVGFSITEQVETIKVQDDDHDLDGPYEFGHSRFQSERVPNGRLTLRLDDAGAYWANGCKQTIRDTEKSRLEDRLDKFVCALIEVAARKQQHEIECRLEEQRRQEEQRRREEEAQVRAEKRERQKAEQARLDTLLQQTTSWDQADRMRRFIQAAKERHLEKHGAVDSEGDFGQWLTWATAQADRLDPLTESPPSILDETIPEERSHYGRRW